MVTKRRRPRPFASKKTTGGGGEESSPEVLHSYYIPHNFWTSVQLPDEIKTRESLQASLRLHVPFLYDIYEGDTQARKVTWVFARPVPLHVTCTWRSVLSPRAPGARRRALPSVRPVTGAKRTAR